MTDRIPVEILNNMWMNEKCRKDGLVAEIIQCDERIKELRERIENQKYKLERLKLFGEKCGYVYNEVIDKWNLKK